MASSSMDRSSSWPGTGTWRVRWLRFRSNFWCWEVLQLNELHKNRGNKNRKSNKNIQKPNNNKEQQQEQEKQVHQHLEKLLHFETQWKIYGRTLFLTVFVLQHSTHCTSNTSILEMVHRNGHITLHQMFVLAHQGQLPQW